MGVFTQSVAVERDQDGAPRQLEWNGRIYRVAEEPVRWFERRRWWAEEQRAERGRGAGLVDHEIWRLQVRLARAPRSPILTLDLSHHLDSGRWRLVRTHDAAQQDLRESA